MKPRTRTADAFTFIALVLAVTFGLYPAFRAARLSPMEAMR